MGVVVTVTVTVTVPTVALAGWLDGMIDEVPPTVAVSVEDVVVDKGSLAEVAAVGEVGGLEDAGDMDSLAVAVSVDEVSWLDGVVANSALAVEVSLADVEDEGDNDSPTVADFVEVIWLEGVGDSGVLVVADES